ncbi:MAG: hypothetical protein ABIR63_07610 [Sphingomicrobium sp.]
MSITKEILVFLAQAIVFGFFLIRLWKWRGTEKGQLVLSEITPMLAYWFLVAMLFALIVGSAWFNLSPLLGSKQ